MRRSFPKEDEGELKGDTYARGGHLGYFPAGTSKIQVILNTGFSEK